MPKDRRGQVFKAGAVGILTGAAAGWVGSTAAGWAIQQFGFETVLQDLGSKIVDSLTSVKDAIVATAEATPGAASGLASSVGESVGQAKDSILDNLPQAPSFPNMPSMPEMPSMPNIPSLPETPSMPQMPSIPSLEALGQAKDSVISSVSEGINSAKDSLFPGQVPEAGSPITSEGLPNPDAFGQPQDQPDIGPAQPPAPELSAEPPTANIPEAPAQSLPPAEQASPAVDVPPPAQPVVPHAPVDSAPAVEPPAPPTPPPPAPAPEIPAPPEVTLDAETAELIEQPIVIDHQGDTFWESFKVDEGWINENGVTRGDVVKDMISQFAKANGHDLNVLHVGDSVNLKDLLTEDQIKVVMEAQSTKDTGEYWFKVRPHFLTELTKVLPRAA